MSMSKSDVYETVTAAIVEELENGRAPWRQPWSGDPSAALPMNLVSKRPYRGINLLVLGMKAMTFGSPYFLTFKQVKSLGGNVVKGSKSTPVMFWKELMVEDENAEDGKRKILMARLYHVFNVAQTKVWRTRSRRAPCRSTSTLSSRLRRSSPGCRGSAGRLRRQPRLLLTERGSGADAEARSVQVGGGVLQHPLPRAVHAPATAPAHRDGVT